MVPVPFLRVAQSPLHSSNPESQIPEIKICFRSRSYSQSPIIFAFRKHEPFPNPNHVTRFKPHPKPPNHVPKSKSLQVSSRNMYLITQLPTSTSPSHLHIPFPTHHHESQSALFLAATPRHSCTFDPCSPISLHWDCSPPFPLHPQHP